MFRNNFVRLIIILLFSIFIFFPSSVGSIEPGTIPDPKDFGAGEPPIKEPEELLDVIAKVVGWVYAIFFIVAVLFILFAAFNYLSGGSNPEKIKTANKQLIYAAIAIVVALLSVGLARIIKNFLEGERGGPSPPGNIIRV